MSMHPLGTSVRRKRTGADEFLEQFDHFRLAGNFSDRPFMIFVYCPCHFADGSA